MKTFSPKKITKNQLTQRSPLQGVVFKTDFGWAGAAASSLGLRHLILHHQERGDVETRLKDLGARMFSSPPPALQPVVRGVKDYFQGKPVKLDFRLDLSGFSPFTQRVMDATRKIGRGEVQTYGEVAAAAGSPRAARAVGVVMAKNPLSLAVP
jgi:methylated-DNA-[protein]-cysteine S-methyltransferase